MSVLRGAAAGMAATIPMTLVMQALRAWLPREQQRPMPPREIVENAVEKAGADAHVGEDDRTVITAAAHLAFGAAAGAVYGGLVGSRRASVLSGIGYGLAVWAGAYGVGMPSLGLHPAAENDTTDRNEVLIGSHIVWGAVLGALVAEPARERGRQISARARRRDTRRRRGAGVREDGREPTAVYGAFRK